MEIDDREQRLRIKLKDEITVDERDGVQEIVAKYPARASEQVFNAVKDSGAEKYQTNVTQESFLGSMLSMLLPMIILFGVLFWLMSRMQQGAGGMFGIGGSKAKELTKDMPTNTFEDVAGADEAVDELQEIKDFLEDPTRYHDLGAKIRAACCSTALRVPVRPCLPAPWLARPACRSIPSPVLTLWRCSSAWVPPVCATYSSRRRKIAPALSSWMRLTPWAASAVPVPAAATMSVSRPSTSSW